MVYSVAIHAVRGHFHVNENGVTLFRPDEGFAQAERGGKHLLANLIGQCFHWLVCVELAWHPEKRAEELMRDAPWLFSRLTAQERAGFPDRLYDMCLELKRSGMPLYSEGADVNRFVRLRVTQSEVEDLLRSYGYPGTAGSNEGMDRR